jgi:tetratricopeptide (TPR) repeat protein
LGTTLGVGNFRDPQGLFVKNNRIYICDTGNNRVILVEAKNDGTYGVIRVVTSYIFDGRETPFNSPTDCFVDNFGDIYIADMNNQRIVHFDPDWNPISAIVKPVDQTIDPVADFLPNKFVVDIAGRTFVKALNVNKGLMEFDNRGAFTGYMGANKVTVNPIDYFWKLIATQAQRARMDLFVPMEYNNIAIDKDGFIYAVNYSNESFRYFVRRLNGTGQDILVRRKGKTYAIGDIDINIIKAANEAAADESKKVPNGVIGLSYFVDIAPFDNDSYACLDRTRGRIFIYDFQGNLLYAFGGMGNREGYFLMPTAIAEMNNSLFVLDSRTAALTRFDLTTYGALINDALNAYKAGRYDASAVKWEQVLKMNGNYDMAYIGIGRAAFRQGDYKKAMTYYYTKNEYEGYGRALQLYRKQWMEENLWKIIFVLAFIIVVPFLVKKILKLRREIIEA